MLKAGCYLLGTCCIGLAFLKPVHAAAFQSAATKAATTVRGSLAAAEAFYTKKQYARAEKELRGLLLHSSSDYAANELLGLVLSAEGRDAEATSYFERAVHADPASTPARENLAANYAKRKKNTLAESEFKTLVEQDPKKFNLQHNLGEFYINLGEIAKAVVSLKEAQELEPTDYANGYDLSLAEMMSGRLAEAQAQILALLAVKDTSELHSMLAEVYEKQNRFLLAAKEYQRAVQMDPTEDAIFDWAAELLRHKNLQEAVQVFASGVNIHPQSWRLNVGLGLALHLAGSDKEAVMPLLHAVELDASDSRSYYFLSNLDSVPANESAAVAACFERYARANPNSAQAQLYYASNLWQTDEALNQALNSDKIETLLKRALILDPKLAQAHMQLGVLYFRREDYPRAAAEFGQTVKLDPSLAVAHYRLGQSLIRLGQKKEAAQELETFRKLNSAEKEDPVLVFLLTRQDKPK